MADVYAARDSVLGCEVAVKVLTECGDATTRERFLREARIAASLGRHPHVVTVYDVGEHAGRPFIVMELAAGGTVAARLQRGGPEPQQAFSWLEQAAAALDAASARGVVHRDIKPSNLLLDEYGTLRIADFGISRDGDRTLTQAGEVLGTAGYLAPEQARGEGCTAASDRYALALVARELLPESEPLAVVFRRALATDPGARYPTAAGFVAALRLAFGAETDRTKTHATRLLRVRRGPMAVHRAPKRLRRRLVAAGLVLGAVALAAASAVAGHLLTVSTVERAAVPPAPTVCTASPVDHDANVVVRGVGANAYCRDLARRLSGDSVWSYRVGRSLVAPDHAVSGLSPVCRFRDGAVSVAVLDSGSQSVGRDVCWAHLTGDSRQNTLA